MIHLMYHYIRNIELALIIGQHTHMPMHWSNSHQPHCLLQPTFFENIFQTLCCFWNCWQHSGSCNYNLLPNSIGPCTLAVADAFVPSVVPCVHFCASNTTAT